VGRRLGSVGAALALAGALAAETPLMPLREVRPGMRGTGRTVFAGDRVEEFQVEILGVLENTGPKQSLILARLSGGPLDRTGVLQGMSGSPVYLDGKLAGAVAMAFPFAKDPIAAIRPIEDMLRVPAAPTAEAVARIPVSLAASDLASMLPRPEPALAGGMRLVDIATPVSFGGFTRATVDQFAPQLRALGLEPRQALASGGRPSPAGTSPAPLTPGSMISILLMTGDLSVGADGTVTHIDGPRVYAFGHRLLSVGSTAMPFARAEVIALLPTLQTSFKISTPREWLGAIYQDRSTAVAGVIGARVPLVPVTVTLAREGRAVDTYRMEMVGDRLLAPLLVQMAAYSAIDATERVVGAASYRIAGELVFRGAPAPVRLDNMYAADNGAAMAVSLAAAVPLAYVMQGGFDALTLERVTLNLEAFDEKKQLQIDHVAASRREVRPGDTLEITTTLAGDNGFELRRRLRYEVPVGAPAGPLYFTVADGATTNLADLRQAVQNTPKTTRQLIGVVNALRPNTRAYVRVWRTDPAFQLEGADLPDPPPSVALLLATAQSMQAGITQTRNSKVGEMEIDAGGMVVSGSRTIQVEVKE
jgi:hypothetical protein